jgi:hypothetical protein
LRWSLRWRRVGPIRAIAANRQPPGTLKPQGR